MPRKVPIAVATSAESTAISNECLRASVRSGMSNNWRYHVKENPSHSAFTRGAVPKPTSVSLNEYRIITKIGNDRYKMNRWV